MFHIDLDNRVGYVNSNVEIVLILKENDETSFYYLDDNKLYYFYSWDTSRGRYIKKSHFRNAKASLFSTDGLMLDPKERIVKAIQCANNFVVSVNGENNIISLV